MARSLSADQVQRMQEARKLKAPQWRRLELPQAVIEAYEHGWRMKHQAHSSPSYYTSLAQALTVYLDREMSQEGKAILDAIQDAVQAIAAVSLKEEGQVD